MVSNGSSSGGGQSVFSLDSQQAVMALLNVVRKSELASTDKNELRDLIFLYTNGGHDEGVRIALEKKIKEHGLEMPPVSERGTDGSRLQENSSKQPTIGTIRSAPSFNVSEVDSSPDELREVSEKKPISPQPEPKASQHTHSVPIVKSAPEPAAPKSAPAPEPAVSQPEPTTASSAPNPQEEPPESTQPISSDSSLTRIQEIKALVNEKVGNPVQLVEKNPEIGREYMSALLEAMKRINSGSAATGAMQRLESAYKMVESLDLSAATESTITPKASTTPPQSATEPIPEPMSTSAVSEPVQSKSSVPVANLSQVVDTLTPKTTDATTSTFEPAASEPAAAPVAPKREPVAPTPSYVPPQTAPQQERAIPIKPISAAAAPSQVSGFDSAPQTQEPLDNKATRNPAPIAPLSATPNPIGSQSFAPTQQKEVTPRDSLHTAAIDNGLEQLLEEWSIFKKSGLFGTGPKGREHPLFKRVAGLQIPLLLAGRFEGATQEIKQSITDYMNGWRYEQGLIYEQGETFEHYLRRVIKHILDLQKNRV